jgi:hypothetical protein
MLAKAASDCLLQILTDGGPDYCLTAACFESLRQAVSDDEVV